MARVTVKAMLLAIVALVSHAQCTAVLRETGCVQAEIPEKVIITTIQDDPFFYQTREQGENVCIRNEGFIPDVVAKVADIAGFDYEFRLVQDGNWGSQREDGTWNGMVGEVQRGEAHLAATSLTMSSKRLEAVDFTVPFSHVHLVIAYKRPGMGENPPFDSAETLLSSGIPFGIVRGGSTQQTFEMSQLDVPHRMWVAMQGFGEDVFMSTQAEGLERLRQGGFAFIMESPAAEIIASRRPCDVITVDLPLMERFYAFGVGHNSQLKSVVSRALLQLGESGEMDNIRARYWGNQCN